MLRNLKHRITALFGILFLAIGLSLGISGTASADQWDDLARCESSGNWNASTGNGFKGGLQFVQSTWEAYGGTGDPAQASVAEQKAVASAVLAGQGPSAWPVCSQKVGLSHGGSTSVDNSHQEQNHNKSSWRKHNSWSNSNDSNSWSNNNQSQTSQSSTAASGNTYTVQPGDTPSSIASANGTTWQTLFSLNSGTISDPDQINAGMVIQLS